MKVASVDRLGSWRVPNADARAAAASRLQTMVANSANSVEPAQLSSATELPALPVQHIQETLSRPVLQSDKPTALLTSAEEAATQATAARAAEEAKKEAATPPKEPLSKLLMDQVKSLWDASGKAVEASLEASLEAAQDATTDGAPSPRAHAPSAGLASTGQPSKVTYSVPRPGTGTGSSTR